MEIRDENGKLVDIASLETQEQELVRKYILPEDVVLELGARYGSVSCIINSKLSNKENHVAVEPDARVWSALETNRLNNGCKFRIVKGFISNKNLGLTNLDVYHGGYGATFVDCERSVIPSYTMDYIRQMSKLKFNVLVADCEGFLERFLDENPNLYDELRMIIFEADYPEKCNYNLIRKQFLRKGFKTIVNGFQNVLCR